jgi:hypothetical protein
LPTHNKAFWKDIFGTYLETKLGLFHLLHPIMDMLNPKCELYWKSVVKLRNAIYTYFVEDEASLLKALIYGIFSETGKTLSDTEIRDLQQRLQEDTEKRDLVSKDGKINEKREAFQPVLPSTSRFFFTPV